MMYSMHFTVMIYPGQGNKHCEDHSSEIVIIIAVMMMMLVMQCNSSSKHACLHIGSNFKSCKSLAQKMNVQDKIFNVFHFFFYNIAKFFLVIVTLLLTVPPNRIKRLTIGFSLSLFSV